MSAIIPTTLLDVAVLLMILLLIPDISYPLTLQLVTVLYDIVLFDNFIQNPFIPFVKVFPIIVKPSPKPPFNDSHAIESCALVT